MAKIKSEWTNALYGFEYELDVLEFLWERVDFKGFEDGYTLVGNSHEAGQYIPYTAEEKISTLYDFMVSIFEEKDRLKTEVERLKTNLPVRCGECSKYNTGMGWCDEHSCFVKSNGDFCHPWESNDWKIFNDDDYCSYGERKVKE